MPTLDYVAVTADPAQIPGLAAGTRYVCQNTSAPHISLRYCNSTTNPSTDADIGWFVLAPGEHFTITSYNANDPVWVQTLSGTSGRLTVTIAG